MASSPVPRFGQITSDESTHTAIASHLADLVRECIASRDKWAKEADKNTIVYLHGEWPCPAPDKRIIHQIQNAILKDVVVQTREPIKTVLKPVETGDPGEIFFADPEMYQGMPPGPLDPKWVQMVQPPQVVGMDDMGQAVQEPGAPAETFITLDDKLQAEIWQAVYDRMEKRSKFAPWQKRAITSNEISGWLAAVYEYDEVSKRHLTRTLSVWQAYIDPTAETLDEAAYAGIDVVKNADEAVKLYPDFAAQIREAAKTGTPNVPDGNTGMGRADMNYEQVVVTLRIFWERDQSFPMSEEQAVASGLVIEQEVVDGSAESILARPPSPEDASSIDPVTGLGVDTDGGSSGAAASQPVPRLAYILTTTGLEVTPDSPDWPTRLGIRQMTCIDNSCVDDRECEHHDIPLLHMVNRPIPGRPWGIGEPMFLLNLQRTRNTLIEGMAKYAESFRNPVRAIPVSVADALKKEYGDARVDAERTLHVPDQMYDRPGFDPSKWFWSPPQMAPAPMLLQDILKQEIDSQSGNTEAIRGEMPTGDPSGRAIMALQDSGMSMIQAKSQATENMVERQANLAHFSNVWRLELNDIRSIVSKYPDYVLEASQRKAQASEWDIEVSVVSGSGQQLMVKRQEARVNLSTVDPNTGEPLEGIESVRDALDIDHARERRIWQTEVQPIMAAKQEAEMQAKQKPSSNGSGKQGAPAGNGRMNGE